MQYTIRGFSPKEAAEITGITPDQQRDWRRRGLLPWTRKGASPGWTTFDVVELSALTVMAYAIEECASTMEFAKECGIAAGPHVAFHLSKLVGGKPGEAIREKFGLDGGLQFLSIGRNGAPGLWDDRRKAAADSKRPVKVTVDLESVAELIMSAIKSPLVEVA